jgi:hypothetical protein
MQSLKEVFNGMQALDHVKVAQVRAAQGLPPQVDLSQVDPALLKQAQDYDQIGRILAHRAFADMLKEAIDASPIPDDKKDEELARLMGQANGEKKKDEKKEDDKDKKDEPEGEKKEAAKKAVMKKKKEILAKMAQDPNYVAHLIAKFS